MTGNLRRQINGLAYDFGVKIAQGTVSTIGALALQVTALTGSFYALISASDQMDELFQKNQVAFGGYANTLKAIQYSSEKLASGNSYFDGEDIMNGMKMIQRAGRNARKEFDLVNKSAQATGMSFTQMASTIEKGDFGALAQAGLITNRMALSFQRMGFNARMASEQVHKLIEEANKKGMFEDTVKSLPQLLRRVKQFGVEFVRAILGDPKDPNGFMFTVKRTISQVSDFLYHNLNKIKAVGMLIGQFLKFVFQVVFDFAKRIWHNIASIIGNTDNFFNHFQDKLLSFGLWLGIIRAKISAFFDDYGGMIKKVALIFLALYGISKIGAGIKSAGTAMYFLGQSMQYVGSFSGVLRAWAGFGNAGTWARLQTGIRSMQRGFIALTEEASLYAAAVWSSVAAWAATPIGLIVLAVVALIAYAYILYKNWDKIRAVASKVGDIFIGLALIFMPLLGIPLLLAKYWDDFTQIFSNLWITIKNLVQLGVFFIQDMWEALVWRVKTLWSNFVQDLKSVFSTIYAVLKPIIDPIAKLFDPVKQVLQWIWDKISNILSSDFLGKVVSWIGGASKKLADWSGQKLAAEQQKHGVPVTAKGGVEKVATNNNGTPKAKAATVPVAKVDYNTFNSGELAAGGSNTMTVEKGAIQINVSGNNIDAEKLATLVMKKLEEAKTKFATRSGSQFPQIG